MPEPRTEERIAGAILGAAIGDAMGHPTEFLSAAAIREKYPPNGVQGFELWWTSGTATFAPYTDDTQMAEIVVHALIKALRDSLSLDQTMAEIAAGFVNWRNNPQGGHRAPGNACLAGAANLERGVHWTVAGGETAGGCGSVMRAYPFGLAFHKDIERAEAWAVEHSRMTHRDPIALAACAAMSVGIAVTLNGSPLASTFEAMIEAASRYSSQTAAMIDRAVSAADNRANPDDVLGELQGWAAHEAIAAAAFVFARHPTDARAAVLEGANAHGDSDSIATLAGALVGARTGLSSIPSDWRASVERGQDLLALAEELSELLRQ